MQAIVDNFSGNTKGRIRGNSHYGFPPREENRPGQLLIQVHSTLTATGSEDKLI